MGVYVNTSAVIEHNGVTVVVRENPETNGTLELTVKEDGSKDVLVVISLDMAFVLAEEIRKQALLVRAREADRA